jgi:pilus assembly protein CpaB
LRRGQAEVLARARQTGTISLALRSLLDANAPTAPRNEAAGEGIVTVYRGGEEREIYSCTPLCKRGSGG